MEAFLEQLAAQGPLDWFVMLTGLVYVVLAARESVWCWPWGILSCAAWAYGTFTLYDLWVDALLQLFYVGMGFWGLYAWLYGGSGKTELPITRMQPSEHVLLLLVGSVLALLFGWLFDTYTPAAASYLDAFTTVFAILTTLLVVRKKLENWIYWMVIDALYVYLYLSRGAVLWAILMSIYVLVAAMGWVTWRRKWAAG